ncbi:MAG: three-Cys-motif partner protein TcmP [Candidatus Acidiferrum sp.]|jgi:three-Cys-motif partner protein
MSEDEQDRGTQSDLFGPADRVDQDSTPKEPELRPIQSPVWTDNKALLIMHYLHYFVLLTKHGTYIDGFAGPQSQCETESWAAKLVLASEPRWIRHFHLCDENRSQVSRLTELKNSQPSRDSKNRKLNRKIHIYHGDFNSKVDEILGGNTITEKEATFCLLDQRTFECWWQSIEKLATYKKSGNKIEIFYFLANGWLERALAAQKDTDVLARWWGRDDWTQLRQMSREERRDALVARLKREMHYNSVKAWPIYERENGGAIMYYMIHATDHPEAPKFMSRAYRRAVLPLEPIEQLTLALFNESDEPPAELS